MLYVSSVDKSNKTIDITDTDDYTVTRVGFDDIASIVGQLATIGVSVEGITDKRVSVYTPTDKSLTLLGKFSSLSDVNPDRNIREYFSDKLVDVLNFVFLNTGVSYSCIIGDTSGGSRECRALYIKDSNVDITPKIICEVQYDGVDYVSGNGTDFSIRIRLIRSRDWKSSYKCSLEKEFCSIEVPVVFDSEQNVIGREFDGKPYKDSDPWHYYAYKFEKIFNDHPGLISCAGCRAYHKEYVDSVVDVAMVDIITFL